MKYVAILSLGFILLFLATLFLYEARKEGFEDTAEESLKKLYGTFSEVLCPALSDVLQELEQDPDNRPIQDYLQKNARFPLLTCPPVQDVATLPPNIGQQIVNTINYLADELSNVNDKLEDSLKESCKRMKNEEDFVDLDRDAICRERLNAIVIAISPQEISQRFYIVKTIYEKMKKIKKNPDAVKSAC